MALTLQDPEAPEAPPQSPAPTPAPTTTPAQDSAPTPSPSPQQDDSWKSMPVAGEDISTQSTPAGMVQPETLKNAPQGAVQSLEASTEPLPAEQLQKAPVSTLPGEDSFAYKNRFALNFPEESLDDSWKKMPPAAPDPDKIAQLVSSNNDPVQAFAQGDTDKQTARAAVDQHVSDFDAIGDNWYQKSLKYAQMGLEGAQSALSGLAGFFGGIWAPHIPAIAGAPEQQAAPSTLGTLAKGAGELVQSGAQLAGSALPAEFATGDQAEKVGMEQQGKPSPEDAAALQQAGREVSGSLETGFQSLKGLVATAAQRATDAELAAESTPQDIKGDVSFLNAIGLPVHKPWQMMSNDEKDQVLDQAKNDYQQRQSEASGFGPFANTVAQGQADQMGFHAMTPLELQSQGRLPRPEAIEAGQLLAQLPIAALNPDELLGLGGELAKFTLQVPRWALWAPGGVLKGTSAVLSNPAVSGTVGILGGIASAGALALRGEHMAALFAAREAISSPFEAKYFAGWAPNIAKGAIPFDYLSNIFKTAGEQQIGNNLLMAQADPLSRAAATVAGGAARGGINMGAFALGAQNVQQAGQMVGTGMALGGLASAPGAGRLAFAAPFDHLFVRAGAPPDGSGQPSPAYGTHPSFDEMHTKALQLVPEDWQRRFNDLREVMKPLGTQIYAADPDNFSLLSQDKANGIGTERGFYFRNDPSGVKQAFVRTDSVPEALYHEGAGHPLLELMDPSVKPGFIDAAKSSTDMDRFSSDYLSRLMGKPVNVQYDLLHPDTKSMLDDEVGAEHIAHLFNGRSATEIAAGKTDAVPPFLAGMGSVLEKLGFPPVSELANTVLGVRPSVKAAIIADQAIKGIFQEVPRVNVSGAANAPAPKTEAGGPSLLEKATEAAQTAQGKHAQILGPQGTPVDVTDWARQHMVNYRNWTPEEANKFIPEGQTSMTQALKDAMSHDAQTAHAQSVKAPQGTPEIYTPPEPAVPQPKAGTPALAPQQEAGKTEGKASEQEGPPPPPTTEPIGSTSGPEVRRAEPVKPGVTVTRAQPVLKPNSEGAQQYLNQHMDPGDEALLEHYNSLSDKQRSKLSPDQSRVFQDIEDKRTGLINEYYSHTNPENAPVQAQLRTEGHTPGEAQQVATGGPMPGVEEPVKAKASVFGGPNDHTMQESTARTGKTYGQITGHWGGDLSNENFPGVSLKESILRKHFGNIDDPAFAAKVQAGQVQVKITNNKTGQSSIGILHDVGPAETQPYDVDLMPGMARRIGINPDPNKGSGDVSYQFIGGAGKGSVRDLSHVASAHQGMFTTVEGSPELACAKAVSRVLQSQGYDVNSEGVNDLVSQLKKGGASEVNPHGAPGDIIYSPTGAQHGHIGMIGEDGRIWSNSSATGKWEPNYTAQSWAQHFGNIHELKLGEATGEQKWTPDSLQGFGQGQPQETQSGVPKTQPSQIPELPSVNKEVSQPPQEKIPQSTMPEGTMPDVRRSEESPILPEDIAQARENAISNIPQGKKNSQSLADEITKNIATEVGTQHSQRLSAGDNRVTLNPDTGFISGQRFVPGDAYHNWLLQGTDPNSQAIIGRIQDAIAKRQDLHIDYGSAPKESIGTATGASRASEQAVSAASERARGLADIQTAGKNIMPGYLGVSLGKGGNPNSVYYGGPSPDKIASNAGMLIHRLGPDSPYKAGPFGDTVAQEDLQGYLHNVNNGWKGDGSSQLQGTETAKVSEPSPNFIPYKMPKERADFWNLAAQGKGAGARGKPVDKTGELTSSGKARQLAETNQGFLTDEGITNALHQKIEKETPGWTDENLHSGYEMLRADLTKGIAENPTGTAKIHPGHEAVAQALSKEGTPPSGVLKAGFMPGDLADKAAHKIKQLDKERGKLDLFNPEDERKWDEITSQMHDLEREQKGHEEAAKAPSFMPGDVVENPKGEREKIRAAAIRSPDGDIYEGPSHQLAALTAIQNGREVNWDKWDDGFTTNSGKFLNRRDAWKLAYKENQLSGGGVAGRLNSESMKSSSFMPSETNSIGAPVKRTDNPGESTAPGEWMRHAAFMAGPEAIPVKYKDNGDPVKIPYNLTKSPLIADKYPEKVEKDATDKMSDQFKYLNPTEAKRVTALDDGSAVKTYASKLVPMIKEWMKDPKIAAGKEWYDHIGAKLQRELGDKAERFMQFLGATSPNENPHSNFAYALEAHDMAESGAYDRHVELYNKARDMSPEELIQHVKDEGIHENPKDWKDALAAYIAHHEIIPLRAEGAKYGLNSHAVLKVLTDRWMAENKGPKTRQFNQNITGENDEATIDDWAARTLREIGYKGQQNQWRVQPEQKTGVSNEDFAFGQLVFREAAKRLGMKPKEAQAIAWVGEQAKWVKNGWAKADAKDYDLPFSLAFPEKGARLKAPELREALKKK